MQIINFRENLPAFGRRPPSEMFKILSKYKKKSNYDGPLFVDKAAILSLIRLFYLAQPLNKQTLQKLLVNLCSNSKTRLNILSLLVTVTQGENLFGGLTKSGALVGFQSGLYSPRYSDSTPELVIRRCLEILIHLGQSSPQVVEFFLLETDLISSPTLPISTPTPKKLKGKGKEKEKAPQKQLPLVALISLLQKPEFLENTGVLETLMQLLSLTTKSLPTLVNKMKEKKEKLEKDKLEKEKLEKEKLEKEKSESEKPVDSEKTEDSKTLTPEEKEANEQKQKKDQEKKEKQQKYESQLQLQQQQQLESLAHSEEVFLEKIQKEITKDLLKYVVTVLTTGFTSLKVSSSTLSTLQHLSAIGNNRQIIVALILTLAHEFHEKLNQELEKLISTLHEIVNTTTEVMQMDQTDSSVDHQEQKLDLSLKFIDISAFSSHASTQIILFRLLSAIEYIYKKDKPKDRVPQDKGKEKEKEKEKGIEIEKEPSSPSSSTQKVLPIDDDPFIQQYGLSSKDTDSKSAFSNLDFGHLWKSVSEVFTIVGKYKELSYVASVLLPSIETLFILSRDSVSQAPALINSQPPIQNNENTSSSSSAIPTASKSLSTSSISSLISTSPNYKRFFTFAEAHHKLLNEMLRSNSKLIHSTFSLLIKTPRLLDFDVKRNYFTYQVQKRENRERYPSVGLNIRRDFIFEDSYNQIMGKSAAEVKFGKLNVHFAGEEGIDAGGVSREWLQCLCAKMFDPNYALFVSSAADKTTYQPNRASWVNKEHHLSYFKFVGRIIGKALFDGRLLDTHFTRFDFSFFFSFLSFFFFFFGTFF